MAQTVRPNPKQDQHQAIPMISAGEARRITEDSKFSNSGYPALINSTIREVAAKGECQARMLIPEEVAEQAAAYLIAHGFRVVSGKGMTGILITAAW